MRSAARCGQSARSPASLRIRKRITERRHGNGSMTIHIPCLLFFLKESPALLHARPRKEIPMVADLISDLPRIYSLSNNAYNKRDRIWAYGSIIINPHGNMPLRVYGRIVVQRVLELTCRNIINGTIVLHRCSPSNTLCSIFKTCKIWIDASAANQILRVPRHRSDVILFYKSQNSSGKGAVPDYFPSINASSSISFRRNFFSSSVNSTSSASSNSRAISSRQSPYNNCSAFFLALTASSKSLNPPR